MAKPRPLDLSVEFIENDFYKNVFDDNYILVIGSEVILNKDLEAFQDCDGDINKYIVSKLNNTDFVYEKISHLLADGITTDKTLRKTIEVLNYDINNVSPELLAFLKTKLFKFVITTTIDHYMSVIMDDVWGKDNWQECNIFNQDSLRQLQDQIKNKKIKKPTLFYLFGQSCKNPIRSKFVATENDAIKLIANNWISNSEEEGKTNISILKNYISNKRLLALGCKFDDWYFRFFWYSLKGGLQGENSQGGEVAISWKCTESDDNLKRYLDNTNYVSILPDARSFMNELATGVLSRQLETIKMDRDATGIFLSYHGPDFSPVFNIFRTLHDKGYNVWLDHHKLHAGDHYNQDITEAIAHCQIFMPVISSRMISKLNNLSPDEEKPYFMKEWNLARQNKKMIMPISINNAGKEGFDVFNNYFFGSREEHENDYLTGTDLTEIDAWDHLIKQINKSL